MKIEHTLLLVLAVTTACSRENSQDRIRQITDSTKLVSKHRELEKIIRDYYFLIEQNLRMDLGVSEAEIIKRVQSMIDKGYVERPAILIITDEGARWARVDYATYKELMADHAVASRRYHGIQPNILDSLAIDSIRSNLLKALKGDSVQ